MKAIAQDVFGPPDVLQLREVEDPTVDAHQVLVRVRAASPNPWDWHFIRDFRTSRDRKQGWRKPKNEVLGSDIAGEVEAVGKDVTRFRPGDEVFGFVGHGAFAEYVSVPEDVVALMPAGVSFEQAATVFPSLR
jgi:NADPH:quinone reductase-like Zn-dependent oxidoreductase